MAKKGATGATAPAEPVEVIVHESTEVVEAPRQQGVSIEALLQNAVDKGVSVETMERLLAMRRELKAEAAKEEFDIAMSKFQTECPTIEKTKEVKTRDGSVAYSFAPIDSIVKQVKPYMQKHGFSYSSAMKLTEAGVLVTVRAIHSAGHSEESSMEVPLGTKTNVMSDTQVVAAASTFAKRYAFCNAFGILSGDEDTDGPRGQEQTGANSDDRMKRTIGAQLVKLGHNVGGMTKTQADALVLSLSGLDMLPANYEEIISRLNVILQERAEAGQTIT